MSSCDLIQFKQDQGDDQESKAVARVKNTYLNQSDLVGIVPDNISIADSIQIVNQYIDSWIKKQLMIDKASTSIQLNESELERKVLDYRYALIVHEYEKIAVNQMLETQVTEEEILEYYNDKQDNFILKQNIIRGLFVKLPKEAPRITNIRNQVRSYPNANLEEMRSYCYQFAKLSHLDDSLWVNFNEIIKNTPLASIPNKVQYLRSNNFVETSDDEFVYLLKILEYKISDEISPLDYVRDNIINIIINKRKIELTRNLEAQTMKEAEERNEFEKYNIE